MAGCAPKVRRGNKLTSIIRLLNATWATLVATLREFGTTVRRSIFNRFWPHIFIWRLSITNLADQRFNCPSSVVLASYVHLATIHYAPSGVKYPIRSGCRLGARCPRSSNAERESSLGVRIPPVLMLRVTVRTLRTWFLQSSCTPPPPL